MYWIYILKCHDEDYNEVYYIGQTKRLFRRFNEHNSGSTINTNNYKPHSLIGLYRASKLSNFFRYSSNILNPKEIQEEADYMQYSFDNRFVVYNNKRKQIMDHFEEEWDEDYNDSIFDIENDIAELMINKYGLDNVRGGKYVRFNCNYSKPTKFQKLPYCSCNLPCDIKLNKDGFFFFRCPKKNIWAKATHYFDCFDGISESLSPCKFFKKFKGDEFYKDYQETNKKLISAANKKLLSELFKKSKWLVNVPNYEDRLYGAYYSNCIGKGDPYKDHSEEEVEEKICNNKKPNDMISYLGNKKVLCWDCFKKNNYELSKKYTIKSICIIMSDSEDDN